MMKFTARIASLSLIILSVLCQASAEAQSFRVLVVTSRAPDHLKMIAAARPFFEKMAAENDFDLDFTDDTSQINPANLAHYQVFVMLHLAPFDMSYAQQEALQEFVEKGGGWVGIHAAGLTGKEFLAKDTRYWQWFEDFMGGITYSPHPAYQHATLVIEDRNHPATRHLPARMDIPDEWYEFNKSPRNTVHVLASVDESTYHQNKPMGDHPIIWTNEHYRRMIYIGPGHSPELLTDPNYANLLRDAICWAATTGPADLTIPMQDGRVTWQRQYTLPLGPNQSELYYRLKTALSAAPFSITTADPETGTILGTGNIKVSTSAEDHANRSGRPNPEDHYYLIRFNYAINVHDHNYTFKATHLYEKPVGIGTTSEYSKIEYRTWDNRLGHPWSPPGEDHRLIRGLDSTITKDMDDVYTKVNIPLFHTKLPAQALAPTQTEIPKSPRFRTLAFYSTTVEPDHVDFAHDAIRFYSAQAEKENFTLDTTSSWDNCNDSLKNYKLVIWLNDFPHAENQRSAFQHYMEHGGAWLGFHVSGYNDKSTNWPWFVHFFGDAVFYNNSWPPLPAKLIVNDTKHPVTRRLPDHYTAPINEWYGWQPNPINNKDVKVLVTLAPSNYPLGKKDILRGGQGGDIPVVWTNTRYHMLYLNMGHGDQIFTSPIQNRMFEDAIHFLTARANP